MLRSMYSGISGMKNFQTKLDVIGNNIANVNTFGFKKGRATFKDALNQMVSGASAAGDVTGGRNAIQVGLGSTLSAVDTVHTNSNLQTTGRSLDLGIEGDGYFILGEMDPDATSYEVDLDALSDPEEELPFKLTYTRAGNLYIDQEGYLVNTDGLYVMGIKTEGEGDTATQTFKKIQVYNPEEDMISSFSIGASGDINVVDNEGTLKTIGKVALATFSNTSGLEKVGNNTYQKSNNSGDPIIGVVGDPGKGSIASGFLEMSNVDLSEEFTEMIVAQRGFQANTRIITTSDEILQELVNLKR